MYVTENRAVVDLDTQLRLTNTLLKKREREILSDYSVTPPQFEALAALREYGALTMGELCEKMFLACSTATDLVDRLERNGFVERVRDTVDRRVVRLKVLAKGEQIADEVTNARRSQLAGVLASVSLEDKEALIQSLEHLQYYLRKA
ncbi:MAG: MarR family transcriptional regulator [Symbiobacteriaceae bacterium]|jgi:DNA-binding MarR family transcriptional regulator|nr:MarR family transcriptional regulator [Symbiobacteriaceae bacterium]